MGYRMEGCTVFVPSLKLLPEEIPRKNGLKYLYKLITLVILVIEMITTLNQN
jgi:hypothetical protein